METAVQLQPPKDWSLAEEQRKARKKKNKELWDEYYEARMYAKKDNDARLTRKHMEGRRLSMKNPEIGGTNAYRDM